MIRGRHTRERMRYGLNRSSYHQGWDTIMPPIFRRAEPLSRFFPRWPEVALDITSSLQSIIVGFTGEDMGKRYSRRPLLAEPSLFWIHASDCCMFRISAWATIGGLSFLVRTGDSSLNNYLARSRMKGLPARQRQSRLYYPCFHAKFRNQR